LLDKYIPDANLENMFDDLLLQDNDNFPIKEIIGAILLLIGMLLIGSFSRNLSVAAITGLFIVILNASVGLWEIIPSSLTIVGLIVLIIGDSVNRGGLL